MSFDDQDDGILVVLPEGAISRNSTGASDLAYSPPGSLPSNELCLEDSLVDPVPIRGRPSSRSHAARIEASRSTASAYASNTPL